MGVMQIIPTLNSGSSPASTTTTTTAAPTTTTTTTHAGTTYPWTSGIIGIGDSMTVPAGATSSWFERVNSFKGTSGTKYASAGQGMAYAMQTLFTNLSPNRTVPLAAFIGFNDVRVTSGEAVRYEYLKAAYRAIAAMQFAAVREQVYSGNTNCSFSGSSFDASATFVNQWYSSAMWFRANGTPAASFFMRASSVLNETITYITPSACDNIVIGTYGFSSAHPASRFSVTIDGVLKTTYDPNNRSDEAIAQQINDAIVITGLSNTTHTVVIKFLDAGVLAGVDWIGHLKTAAACASIPLFILDMPHLMNGAGIGYNTSGFVTTQAILDGATSARQTDLQSKYSGYPIRFVDINTTYTPDSTHTNSDGVHETDLGQAQIASRVEFYLT